MSNRLKVLIGVLLTLAAFKLVDFAIARAQTLVTGNNASLFPTTLKLCSNPVQSTVNLFTDGGTAATTVPTTAAAGRRFITVCSSAENSGAPQVKCRQDGTSPVMGLGNAGDVLNNGDCVTYNNSSGSTVSCISGAAAYVNATECR